MGFTVSEILQWTGGRLANEEAIASRLDSIRVSKPAPLPVSQPSDLAFFFSRIYESEIPRANPGVLITAEPFVKPLQASGLPVWKTAALIVCADPYLALAVLSEKFAKHLSSVAHSSVDEAPTEIHPSAVVHPSAKIGPHVKIGAGSVISENATIGKGSVLYPGCFVGPGVQMGELCVLFPGVTLYEWTVLGKGVRIHAGSVLGSDGFGYAPKREGKAVVGHQKIYHLGRVVVGDFVEIGANSCVDRSTFGDTVIGSHAKLDNLVHVGHNAQVDEGAILCGGVCLAGNAHIGRYAYVGGLTGVTNHVHVGDGAQVGAVSLVTKDVPPGGTAVGNPQRDHKQHFKAHAMLSRLLAERKKKND